MSFIFRVNVFSKYFIFIFSPTPIIQEFGNVSLKLGHSSGALNIKIWHAG